MTKFTDGEGNVVHAFTITHDTKKSDVQEFVKQIGQEWKDHFVMHGMGITLNDTGDGHTHATEGNVLAWSEEDEKFFVMPVEEFNEKHSADVKEEKETKASKKDKKKKDSEE
jgi:hypothetical protein